jgi:hypothetical protein
MATATKGDLFFAILVSLNKGRISDAIRSVERVRCFRAASQSAPERLRVSGPSVLRPRREVLSLDWDRIGRVTPACFLAARDLFGKPVSTFPDRALSKSQEAWPGAGSERSKSPARAAAEAPEGERASESR